MKRLIPALFLAASLFAHPVYAQAPAKPSDKSAEMTRFIQSATTQQKIKMLDLLVQDTNAKLADYQTEVFASIKISHRYPSSSALDYTLTIRPELANKINIKQLQSPEGTAGLQSVLQRAMRNSCNDSVARPMLEALGITEMRAIFMLNGRIINQSRAPLSQCSQF